MNTIYFWLYSLFPLLQHLYLIEEIIWLIITLKHPHHVCTMCFSSLEKWNSKYLINTKMFSILEWRNHYVKQVKLLVYVNIKVNKSNNEALGWWLKHRKKTFDRVKKHICKSSRAMMWSQKETSGSVKQLMVFASGVLADPKNKIICHAWYNRRIPSIQRCYADVLWS